MPADSMIRFVRPAVFAAALALASAAAARAQTGAFVNSSPPWTGPLGGAGVLIQSGQLWVDANGNDLTDPGVDTFHPIPPGISGGWQLRLSPSRRVMVAITSTGASCPGAAAAIRLYAIPAQNGASLVQLGTDASTTNCINEYGFFDDPTKGVRTAWFRYVPTNSSGARVVWFDMVTGVHATSAFDYTLPFGYVKFAPFGTMAWVQHDVNGPGGTNYSIVSLCPPTLGAAAQPGLTGQSGTRDAFVEGSPGSYTVAIRGDANALITSYAYSDCAVSPPPTGACCLPGGGCLGGTTSGECAGLGGTWNSGVACATAPCPPPPAPVLGVTLAAPDTASRGGLVTYTLGASNTGTLASNGVVLTNTFPPTATFVSASDGGTPSGTTVTWSLGTLAPGAAVSRTLVVRASCSATSMTNATYQVAGTPGGTVVGSPARTTVLVAQVATPIGVLVGSTPLATPPLRSGQRVRHTIQLLNTTAGVRTGVNFTVLAGDASFVATIVDSGGGSAANNFSSLQWTGTLPASGSRTIVYETEIRACRAEAAATERMNRGNPILVYNACSAQIGIQAAPAAIAVAGAPVVARLASPSHGPGHSWGTNGANRLLLVRPGATIDLEMRVLNLDSAPAPACSVSFAFPATLLPATDPPFVGTPPAGATWNSATRTITWKGAPPALDSVRVAFRATPAAGSCSAFAEMRGSYATCTNFLNSGMQILSVPLPPAGGHLAALGTTEGLLTWDAGGWKPLLCGTWEYFRGMGRAPDGTYWVVGTPSFRFNPSTLDFQVLPASFFTALDMDTPYDVAADPRDSTLVFSGYKSGVGLRLRRYDPDNQQVTAILNDTAPMTLGPGYRVDVANDGLIAVALGLKAARVNPANPAAYQVSAAPTSDGIAGLGVDLDGHFLVTEDDPTGNGPRRIFRWDRITGAFTPTVDLHASFGTFSSPTGVAVSPDSSVYVGAYVAGVRQVSRRNGNAIASLGYLGTISDLEWVGAPVNVASAPGDRAAPAHGLALAAAPNPFRAATTLRLTLAREAHVDVAVYDLVGRRVRVLAHGVRAAGEHALAWDGRDGAGRELGAGLYFACVESGGDVRRASVVKLR